MAFTRIIPATVYLLMSYQVPYGRGDVVSYKSVYHGTESNQQKALDWVTVKDGQNIRYLEKISLDIEVVVS